jgi:hypothetical protein
MKMTTLWSPEVDRGSRGRQRHVLLALGERSMARGRKEVPVVMEPFLTRRRRSKRGGLIWSATRWEQGGGQYWGARRRGSDGRSAAVQNRRAALTSGLVGKVGPSVQRDRWAGREKKKKQSEFEFDNSKIFKFDSFRK